jgi:hypothetical protein
MVFVVWLSARVAVQELVLCRSPVRHPGLQVVVKVSRCVLHWRRLGDCSGRISVRVLCCWIPVPPVSGTSKDPGATGVRNIMCCWIKVRRIVVDVMVGLQGLLSGQQGLCSSVAAAH